MPLPGRKTTRLKIKGDLAHRSPVGRAPTRPPPYPAGGRESSIRDQGNLSPARTLWKAMVDWLA